MDDLRKHLHNLVDGETNPLTFDDVWRKTDMPRKNRNAKRRSGLWWAASGIAAAAVVAAFIFTGSPGPGHLGHQHHVTPPPASQGQGTRVSSVGGVVASPSFSSIDMTSIETGWAEVNNKNSLSIVRTTNQGSTWTDVTPSGTSASGMTIAFQPTGPDSALLAAIVPTQSATVYVTTDGGKTWTHGKPFPIKYGDGNAYLAVNGKDVWIEIGEPGMANALPAQLFHSADGGLTFRLVTESASSASSRNTFPGFGPLVFLGPDHGFTSAVHGGALGVGLYQTTDGGKTWSAVHFPNGAQQAGLPVFSGQSGLVWAVQASSATNPTDVFFRTTDGGTSWTAEPIRIGNDTMSTYDIINGATAIVAGMSGNIYSTTDGGASWHVTSPAGSAQGLLGQNMITEVSFTSPQVGWALMGPRGHAVESATLYLTTDGGQSWTQVAR